MIAFFASDVQAIGSKQDCLTALSATEIYSFSNKLDAVSGLRHHKSHQETLFELKTGIAVDNIINDFYRALLINISGVDSMIALQVHRTHLEDVILRIKKTLGSTKTAYDLEHSEFKLLFPTQLHQWYENKFNDGLAREIKSETLRPLREQKRLLSQVQDEVLDLIDILADYEDLLKSNSLLLRSTIIRDAALAISDSHASFAQMASITLGKQSKLSLTDVEKLFDVYNKLKQSEFPENEALYLGSLLFKAARYSDQEIEDTVAFVKTSEKEAIRNFGNTKGRKVALGLASHYLTHEGMIPKQNFSFFEVQADLYKLVDGLKDAGPGVFSILSYYRTKGIPIDQSVVDRFKWYLSKSEETLSIKGTLEEQKSTRLFLIAFLRHENGNDNTAWQTDKLWPVQMSVFKKLRGSFPELDSMSLAILTNTMLLQTQHQDGDLRLIAKALQHLKYLTPLEAAQWISIALNKVDHPTFKTPYLLETNKVREANEINLKSLQYSASFSS